MHQRHPFDISKPVQVYRNLNNRCWSIKQKGLVVAHSYEPIVLFDVTYKVNQTGRERVLQTKRKNVHAYVCGYIIDKSNFSALDTFVKKAYYNPYNTETFVDMDTKKVLTKVSYCLMTSDFNLLYRD